MLTDKKNIWIAVVVLAVILFLLLRRKANGKMQLKPTGDQQPEENYIASPSGIEFTGCYGGYGLKYPYPFGYGGYGANGAGMIPQSFADIYNSEIGACEVDYRTGRVRCMR
jgi:hypothetical protein